MTESLCCPSEAIITLLIGGMCIASDVSDSLRSHGLYPTGLLCPWGSSTQEY